MTTLTLLYHFLVRLNARCAAPALPMTSHSFSHSMIHEELAQDFRIGGYDQRILVVWRCKQPERSVCLKYIMQNILMSPISVSMTSELIPYINNIVSAQFAVCFGISASA
jgi:hypothetical protein